MDDPPPSWYNLYRSSRPGVFLVKGVLKICSKFLGEHPCRNVISVKLLCSFIEMKLRRGCSPLNLLHNFRTPFPMNATGWLFLLVITFRTRNYRKLYILTVETIINVANRKSLSLCTYFFIRNLSMINQVEDEVKCNKLILL